MAYIKTYENFEFNEEESKPEGKIIPVKFNYEGVDYTFDLEVEDEDFWTTFYSEKDGEELNFDVHYCEEYNSIAVYPINMETLETDHTTTIVSQPIFSEEEFAAREAEILARRDDTVYFSEDDEDDDYL